MAPTAKKRATAIAWTAAVMLLLGLLAVVSQPAVNDRPNRQLSWQERFAEEEFYRMLTPWIEFRSACNDRPSQNERERNERAAQQAKLLEFISPYYSARVSESNRVFSEMTDAEPAENLTVDQREEYLRNPFRVNPLATSSGPLALASPSNFTGRTQRADPTRGEHTGGVIRDCAIEGFRLTPQHVRSLPLERTVFEFCSGHTQIRFHVTPNRPGEHWNPNSGTSHTSFILSQPEGKWIRFDASGRAIYQPYSTSWHKLQAALFLRLRAAGELEDFLDLLRSELALRDEHYAEARSIVMARPADSLRSADIDEAVRKLAVELICAAPPAVAATRQP